MISLGFFLVARGMYLLELELLHIRNSASRREDTTPWLAQSYLVCLQFPIS